MRLCVCLVSRGSFWRETPLVGLQISVSDIVRGRWWSLEVICPSAHTQAIPLRSPCDHLQYALLARAVASSLLEAFQL